MGKYFYDIKTTEPAPQEWGVAKWVIDPAQTGYKELSTCYVEVNPGKGHLNHVHEIEDEILYILSGTALQKMGDEEKVVKEGELIYIPAGIYHETLNIGEDILKFLAVYSPAVRTT